MKSLIAAICISVILIIGSFIYTSNLEKISTELANANTLTAELIESGNYSAAAQILKQTKNYMEEKKTLLAATGNHEDINKIELYLAELEAYVTGKNQVDALSRCSILEQIFDHLPKNYKLKAENIL